MIIQAEATNVSTKQIRRTSLGGPKDYQGQTKKMNSIRLDKGNRD